MAAWFALTAGDDNQMITACDIEIQVAGPQSVSVQLTAPTVQAWARLGNAQQVDVAMDRGRSIFESLPGPCSPDGHFVMDPTKWHFYAMDVYRNIHRD